MIVPKSKQTRVVGMITTTRASYTYFFYHASYMIAHDVILRRVCGKPYMSAHIAYNLQSLEKIRGDALVVVIIPTTLVCLLFGTIIPISLCNFL